MSVRAQQHSATVLRRQRLADHLLRLTLGGEGLAGFTSTGVPDEWVGLVVPGQFQSRYYTVRSWDGAELVLDVVVHDVGLVTEWAQRPDAVVGETVTVTDPKGSFAPPAEAGWLMLVGDLTAMPAMARIVESTDLPVRVWGLYLAGSRLAFERNEIQLHQVLVVRTDDEGGDGFPLRPSW